ncbi:hypothetical protein CUR178_06425 [Leishmania enriettii]|uniref:Uncharacterized protein n=1 Tax=Leishmania enriettii TaxID=5663 RepID=A0A836KX37_LEIEN|nr:hypothetical protein CUR178_06425 [Leishmania enriettii]
MAEDDESLPLYYLDPIFCPASARRHMLASPRHKTESASHPSARTGATMLRSASLPLMSVKIGLTCAQPAHLEAASMGRRGLQDRQPTSEVGGSGGGTVTMGTSWSAAPTHCCRQRAPPLYLAEPTLEKSSAMTTHGRQVRLLFVATLPTPSSKGVPASPWQRYQQQWRTTLVSPLLREAAAL